jgi:phospholipid N-methyltransferase
MFPSATFKAARHGLKRSVDQFARTHVPFGTIGAICESSPWLSKRIAGLISDPNRPIIELGAGFGSVTSQLPPTTISLETEAERFAYLKRHFPQRNIIDHCAIAYLDKLTIASTIVSCIPSVNNPDFERLHHAIARAHRAGMIAQFITYTYFPRNPFADIFPGRGQPSIELRNIPPAVVWNYDIAARTPAGA